MQVAPWQITVPNAESSRTAPAQSPQGSAPRFVVVNANQLFELDERVENARKAQKDTAADLKWRTRRLRARGRRSPRSTYCCFAPRTSRHVPGVNRPGADRLQLGARILDTYSEPNSSVVDAV